MVAHHFSVQVKAMHASPTSAPATSNKNARFVNIARPPVIVPTTQWPRDLPASAGEDRYAVEANISRDDMRAFQASMRLDTRKYAPLFIICMKKLSLNIHIYFVGERLLPLRSRTHNSPPGWTTDV